MGRTPTNLLNDLIFQSSAPLAFDAGSPVGFESVPEVELRLDEVLGPVLELEELVPMVEGPPDPPVVVVGVGRSLLLSSPLLLGVVVVGRGLEEVVV